MGEVFNGEWQAFSSPQWAKCYKFHNETRDVEPKTRTILAWRYLNHRMEYMDHMGITWAIVDDPNSKRAVSYFFDRFLAPNEVARWENA